MKASIQVANPDSVEMTLTVTMPLKDWKSLREQLAESYPSWKLSSQIGSMVHKASESFNAPPVERDV